ncbi:endonuclease 8-like 1 isoform X2 [Betta splendens]|uniref:Endonuclease 8-like 1 n=1 Tax=Betta splendens TaxID=158456 RepID=A0A6P7MV57_BETSP|nr:endonuclease 8-like 1 isoform X2 [Betta splendens]
MPEGPELHLASLYVNEVCDGVVFTGAVRKSEVSKCPDVPFTCEAYRITATSRGKEVKLTLTPIKSADSKRTVKSGQADQAMDVVFRFGMSGYFRFSAEDELPKHAHLRFYTKEKSCRVLSFVDTRRFGSWQPSGTWQRDRGPCVMFEYSSFRENVVSHLSDRVFDRPVCEVLLNQKYFNGIGNYLRAEILYRLNIPPFVSARSVLESLEVQDSLEKEKAVKHSITGKKSDKVKEEDETSDLLRMCHMVPLEVVNLGGKGYDPAKADYSGFMSWLQCYAVEGMNCLQDHNGRTMWFKGDPGPMVPKGSRSTRAKILVKKERNDDNADKKKVARSRSESTLKKRPIKQEVTEIKAKDASLSEAGSKKRKTGKTAEETKPRRSRNSGEKAAAGSQRRSGRIAKQNSK